MSNVCCYVSLRVQCFTNIFTEVNSYVKEHAYQNVTFAEWVNVWLSSPNLFVTRGLWRHVHGRCWSSFWYNKGNYFSNNNTYYKKKTIAKWELVSISARVLVNQSVRVFIKLWLFQCVAILMHLLCRSKPIVSHKYGQPSCTSTILCNKKSFVLFRLVVSIQLSSKNKTPKSYQREQGNGHWWVVV